MITLAELTEKASRLLEQRPDLANEPVWLEFQDMDGISDLVLSESGRLYLTEQKA